MVAVMDGMEVAVGTAAEAGMVEVVGMVAGMAVAGAGEVRLLGFSFHRIITHRRHIIIHRPITTRLLQIIHPDHTTQTDIPKATTIPMEQHSTSN